MKSETVFKSDVFRFVVIQKFCYMATRRNDFSSLFSGWNESTCENKKCSFVLVVNAQT